MEDNTPSLMMTQRQVAEYISKMLAISYRVVYDQWVHLPDFPKARSLPSKKTRRGPKRFIRSEVEEWTKQQTQQAA